MKVVQTINEYRSLNLTDVGFVPTMGALHPGHCSLIRAASSNESTVVSIFVNPTQFGPAEDILKYPRTLAQDLERAEAAGANVVFVPEVDEVYPEYPTTITVPVVSENFEGAIRPTHFSGVATVVAKLFNIVNPSVAYFGQKDLQQCAVIQKLIQDLNFSVVLKILPTLRESDGLAMSSRNVYLSREERALAPKIYEVLKDVRDSITDSIDVVSAIENGKNLLASYSIEVDYFSLIRRDTFQSIDEVFPDSALIIAARIGGTRLLDNVLIN